MDEHIVLIQLVGATAIILANYFGIKYGLNGLREDVGEIKTDVRTLLNSDAEQNKQIALQDQNLEHLKDRLERHEENHV